MPLFVLVVPFLLAILAAKGDLPPKPHGETVRINRLLAEWQQKRKEAGCFRAEIEILRDEAVFRPKETTHATCMSDGESLIRIDFPGNKQVKEQIWVRTAKDLYLYRKCEPAAVQVPLFSATLTMEQKNNPSWLGGLFSRMWARLKFDTLLMTGGLPLELDSSISAHLAGEDKTWIYLELKRRPPQWDGDFVQVAIDKKTGLAMKTKINEPSGCSTTYTLTHIDRNLPQPIREADLLRDLPTK